MTPRSPKGSRNRPSQPTTFSANPMEKWLEEEKDAVVLMATSHDPDHPAENVLNSDENTFWITTGCFPQEITIGLKQETRIAEVRTVTANARSISVQRVMPRKTTANGPPEWKEVVTTDLSVDSIDQLQTESHKVGPTMCFSFNFFLLDE